MIHVRSFRTAGKCHGFDISRCQDQIRILSDATQTTIVLCDGAGSSPYGGIAASVAASTLAGNLHLNFEQYLHGALPDIRMQLTRTVDTELKKMAKEMQIDPRLLATTMLAISIDTADLSVFIWETAASCGTLAAVISLRLSLLLREEISQIQPI